MASHLELAFLTAWEKYAPDAAQPVQQHRFHSTRRWRFDFAWPDGRLAVETHGGQWNRGRHVTGAGLQADAEKANAAVVLGWRVLTYTTSMLSRDPAGVVAQVLSVLQSPCEK